MFVDQKSGIYVFLMLMITNKALSRTLRLLSQLMELHDENPFKIKSLASASFKIDKLPFQLAGKSLEDLEKIEGLGKSTASKVFELLQTGSIAELNTLLEKTPPGIVEIMGIKGLGPKKVIVIWKELGIESVGELYYACNENRLAEAKGFGIKTQEEIKKAIEFKIASNGRYLYAQVEEIADTLLKRLNALLPDTLIEFAGDYRRRCEIIDKLNFLIGTPLTESILQQFEMEEYWKIIGRDIESIQAEHLSGIHLAFQFCSKNDFFYELVMQTGSESHVVELTKRAETELRTATSEEEVYQRAGLPFIAPELREGYIEYDLAVRGNLPQLVEWNDIKGSLHNHSTWSDGTHTLEEMALFCRDELKLQYLGISDHSKSAFYAKGLSEERVFAQHEEIDRLNKQLSGFRIFKGIESDILFDGSLDYPDTVLKSFDFVVASIHSVFKMTEEKATGRLITAIENPYTTILGHPTGRMLLTRNGYPIDYKKIIDACAANGVVIEINSNPLRLDLDWRWHQYALEKGVMLSINPDAHSNNGFYDMRYGIFSARKGGVSARNCLNTLTLEEINSYFSNRKTS